MTQEVGVYDDPYAPTLLRGKDGTVFEGETLVEFDSAEKPVHFFDERKLAQRSARIPVYFRAVDFEGVLLPRYYPVVCSCDRPVPNGECKNWKPKGGRSSLCQDAAISLGRLPRKGDKLTPQKLFPGRLFKAEVHVVQTDRNKKQKPELLWHSRLGALTSLEAGGGPSAHAFTHSSTDPVTFTNSDAFPVTKTSALPTTKAGNE